MRYDKSFFDAGIQRMGTASEKWDDAAVCPAGTLPMWVADMDFACAEPIKEALMARARHACYGYTMHETKDAEALCGFLARRHALTVTPEQTAMLPCVVTGLRAAVRALTREGERVAILTPVYGPFFFSIEENGRFVERCPLIKDASGRYNIDFARVEQALASGIRLFMLCSPHNPVSRLWTRDELETLLKLTRRYNAALVVDEIHAEFVYPPARFTSILSLVEPDDRVLCLMSASKTFNIAGLQQAMVISKNAPTLDQIKKELRASGAACGNIFALAATRAAYESCDDWLDGMLAYLKHNIDVLHAELPVLLPKAKMPPIEATYLAWLDLSAYAPTTKELMERCARHQVALTGGTFFGAEGEGYLRLNFGCPEAQLREALKRLSAAMNE